MATWGDIFLTFSEFYCEYDCDDNVSFLVGI